MFADDSMIVTDSCFWAQGPLLDDFISWSQDLLYQSINVSEVKTAQSKDESSQSYSVSIWSKVGAVSMLLAWVDLRVFMCFQNSVTLLFMCWYAI